MRLQILTDLFHQLGAAFVQLPTKSLGTGVHCGSGIMDIAQLDKLRTELNGRSFLRSMGSSIALHELGHLVCEARQHCWQHKHQAGIDHFMKMFETTTNGMKSVNTSQSNSRKRSLAMQIVEHAC